MHKLLFTGSLLSALSLSAANTAYVDADNASPESPYATLATAATNILDASSAVDADGVVKIIAGNYGNATGGLANRTDHAGVAFEAVDASDNPAEATIGYKLLSYGGVCPEEGKNQITLQKGTFKMYRASGALYLDLGSGASNYASNTVVVTGADTKLVAISVGDGGFNIGYGMKDSCLKFTDHAVGEFGTLYVSCGGASSVGATLIVENYACVTNGASKQSYFGYNGNDAHIVVSNGTLCLQGQTLLGSSSRAGTTLYVGGATPILDARQLKFLGTSVTTMDMSEAPLDGYATTPIVIHSDINYRTTCDFHITGLDALEKRLIESKAKSAQWTILTAMSIADTTSKEALDAQIERLTAEVKDSNPNFTFKRTGVSTFVVTYTRANAYVVPEGTEGNTPTAPYDTWAKAANSISEAGDYVHTDGGTVTILAGTYNEGRYTKDYPVIYKAVADMSDDPEPGYVTLVGTIMGYGTRYWQSGYDRTARFTSGYFKLASSSSNAFLSHDNAWGVDDRPHFVATGKDTVIDASDKDLYIGYTSFNSTFELLDHALMYSKDTGVGRYETINNINYTIGDGAAHTNKSSAEIGVQSSDVTMVISNGTFSTSTASVDNDTTPKGTKLQFKGENPLFRTSSNCGLHGNAEVSFDVSEAPFTGYKALDVGQFSSFSDSVTFAFDGIDVLQQRMQKAEVPVVRLTLISSRNSALPDALKTKLSAATLPDRCSIVYSGNSAILKVGTIGFVVMAQ